MAEVLPRQIGAVYLETMGGNRMSAAQSKKPSGRVKRWMAVKRKAGIKNQVNARQLSLQSTKIRTHYGGTADCHVIFCFNGSSREVCSGQAYNIDSWPGNSALLHSWKTRFCGHGPELGVMDSNCILNWMETGADLHR